jgi:hypothetical protein
MRNYVRDMKRVIGFAAILVTLLVGMNFVVAGYATAAVPSGVGIANSKSDFNRPNFNRPNFNKVDFNRPAFNNNPFVVRPFFNPIVVNPFFNPFFTPFVAVDNDAFGVDFD